MSKTKQGDRLVEKFDRGDLTEKNEIILALSNKWFRLNTLYFIKNKLGRKVRFRPNYAQRDFYENSWNRNIILKARQLGFTTAEMIDALDDCLFIGDLNAGCIAHTLDDAKDIFRNKIKYAYEKISSTWLEIFDGIGLDFPAPVTDKGEGYVFSNGSSIRVGTSYRGGTLQRLHVSEFGKICKKFPEKAEEIVSGAFEALGQSCRLTVESTAEGQEGRFYDYCKEAEDAKLEQRLLTELDFKFHFYPWWENDDYQLDTAGVLITEEFKEYFEQLEGEIERKITGTQRAWYVKKASALKDKMKREYPGTPKEAFEQAVAGAYYARQMRDVRTEGRIRRVSYDPRIPVYAFFDLGRDDSTAIWFMQAHFDERRFIRYYENSGESIQFYLKKLQEFGYVYDELYLPHDANVIELSRADNKSRADIVRSAGFRVTVVDRVPDKLDAIQAVRDILPFCWFDEELCSQGIKCLDSYHKEWDDKLGRWKDRPKHDWASHGNDSFEQMARGFREPMSSESFEPDWEN